MNYDKGNNEFHFIEKAICSTFNELEQMMNRIPIDESLLHLT